MATPPVYVAYIVWNWAMVRRGVARASSLHLLVPVVGGVFAALFFAEPFTPPKLLGAGLVLLGLVVIRR